MKGQCQRTSTLMAAFLGAGLLALPLPAVAQSDLRITGLSTGGVVTDGQALTIGGFLGVTIGNEGTTPVSTPYTVTVFEDGNLNGAFDPGTDAVLGTVLETAPLAAGASVVRNVPLSGSVMFKGNLLYVFADSGNVITESDETNNLANTGSLSSFTPPPSSGPFAPVLKWHWTPPAGDPLPNSQNVMMTPAVIDLDGDGIPEVVFGTTASLGGALVEVGQLRAIEGSDGSAVFTVSDPTYAINTASSVAAGDIDGDRRPEIIACDSSGTRLIAFEHDGGFKWRSPVLEAVNWGAPAIADLDQDGVPEIIIGRQVLRNDGTILWTGAGGRGSQSNVGALSLVADVDLDGSPEIVAGNTIYRANGTIFTQSTLPDGYNAVANFDADPNPEIVLVSGGAVWLLEHDLTVKWGPVAIPGGGAGGPPTIADYDGDGQAEIGVAGASRYAVFETNGTLKWAAVTQDGSSNVSGSSVFDFEGDGKAEVVYRDELYLRVYRGSDGLVLFQTPMSSCTWYEYVLVADVNGDGRAEIVAVANNNCGFGTQRGVWIYGDSADNWVATRKIWNQHTYHITNVNQDGTIPSVELNNWQQPGLNNYRLNTFAPNEPQPQSLPDLVPSFLRLDQANCPASVAITARTGNGGSLLAPSGVNVSFYDGHPAAGGVLLGTVQTSVPLDPGEFEDVVFTWVPPGIGARTVFIVADDNGAGVGMVKEGFENNNVHSANVNPCTTPCDADADCDDGNVCTADNCDVATGACGHDRFNEGQPCNGDTGVCLDGQCVPVPTAGRADLDVLTACRPIPPCPNGTVSCDVHVFNRAPSSVPQVTVTMDLTNDLQVSEVPMALSVFPASGGPIGMGPPPTVMGQHIEWTASNVPAGGKAATWFTLQVGTLGGTKTVTAAGSIPDPDPINNTRIETITPDAALCPPADFAQKGVDPAAPVCATEELFYVLVFQHPGATTADLTDALDPCLDPATVSALMPEPECMLSGSTIGCAGLPLDASGRGQVSFAARPRLGCALGTVITNQATVTFDDAFQLVTNATANQVAGCEQICNDGLDNDGDGQTDCADSDCQDRPCDDGSLCTGNDQCNAGVCAGTSLCDACQTCDPGVGCTGAPCTPTPTDTPIATPTDTPTETPAQTPTHTPTDTPTAMPTTTPTGTATAAPTDTPMATPTDTATDTPTVKPTSTVTATPTRAPTNTPTATLPVSATPTGTPTRTPGSQPPDCSHAVANPSQLWPPNHKFVGVSVVGIRDAAGDSARVTVLHIAQDEPPNAAADGNTCPDGRGIGTATARLRAERSGQGDGRVYHVRFTADDGRGGSCDGEVTVCVPHDQGGRQPCVDGGPLYDSTTCR